MGHNGPPRLAQPGSEPRPPTWGSRSGGGGHSSSSRTPDAGAQPDSRTTRVVPRGAARTPGGPAPRAMLRAAVLGRHHGADYVPPTHACATADATHSDARTPHSTAAPAAPAHPRPSPPTSAARAPDTQRSTRAAPAPTPTHAHERPVVPTRFGHAPPAARQTPPRASAGYVGASTRPTPRPAPTRGPASAPDAAAPAVSSTQTPHPAPGTAALSAPRPQPTGQPANPTRPAPARQPGGGRRVGREPRSRTALDARARGSPPRRYTDARRTAPP